jgi:mannose-6-phosphate isomerase-like protein (cupin superfamily)
MSEINLEAKLATFSEHWQPRTVAQFNGHDVMVVKAEGEFVWHKHDDTDDFFLVLKGNLTIELRDRKVNLGPGEMFVVPKGVEHRPVAKEEVQLLLIESSGTPNTGDAVTAAARRVI